MKGIQAVWSSKLEKYESEPNRIRTEKLNLFIGPNNSGKSRLLRTLFTDNDLHIAAGETLSEFSTDLEIALDFLQDNDAVGKLSSPSLLKLFQNTCTPGTAAAKIFEEFKKALDGWDDYSTQSYDAPEKRARTRLRRLLAENQARDSTNLAAERLERAFKVLADIKHHYIPILRGMRPLDENDDAFKERTIKDYFHSHDPIALNITTGFDLYELLARFLLGNPEDRQRIREYEKILGHEFFSGVEVTLIPQYGKDTISVKIGDDDQFSIFDLGDGMQQVIIITSAAFLTKEPARFFIEEPELCLHPGLLRKLALFLLNHTEHQYFATTHSNHLLDLAEIDTRVTIHKVSKIGSQADVKFEVKESTKDRELLAELGVSASSVYLANCTVWVEGITDRLYLGVFMKQYIDELEDGARKTKLTGLLENFHYAFVEYQGGTLGHWAFDDRTDTEQLNATRLCATAFLLADGDIVGKGDRANLLQQQLGMRLHLLKGKEIENLLPRNIIIETAKTLFARKNKATVQGLDPALLDKLKADLEVSPHGIGLHLDKALGLKHKGQDARRVFAEESGTIKDKVKFCHAAIEQMNTLEWQLTEPLRALCEQIFEHILSNNHL